MITAASGSPVGRANDERVRSRIRGALELQAERNRHDAGVERKL
jgi:hypothetical protein